MDEKLVPAHIHFSKWFIRIRWLAIIILAASNFTAHHFLRISVREIPIYILASILLVLNVVHLFILRRLSKKKNGNILNRLNKSIHFQIITDLIVLTLLIHYSGGIENPVILFYFFHLIIASSIFSNFQSYLYVSFCLLLTGSIVMAEYFSVIPHYHLDGFADPDLYKNLLYIVGSGIVFTCTAIFVVWLSHMIIYRSIKSEKEYLRTNLELENKDKVKNEYVLRVTHDIKGHVSAIMSCIEVIKLKFAGPLNKEQEEFVARAYQRTELLSDFVKNLLNLTKKRLIHSDEYETFLLKEIIDKVSGPIRILAKDKTIDFNVFIDNSVKTMDGNPCNIEELYSNLLLNAVKYTPPGGRVTLTVKTRFNYIVSEISDSGIGIPSSELEKIFDEFYRASNVPADIKSGSGLGLSIAKQIIEDHKGKIWASSEPGIWTKFTFVIPKTRPD